MFSANRVKVTVFTAKPGMVIGKSGAGVEELRVKIEKLTGKKVIVNVEEVKRPDLSAQLVAENIAGKLERRVSFRRAKKQAMQRSLKAGAKGIKTAVSGRLGGADMARTEGYSEGTIPLQTLRADIEYGFADLSISTLGTPERATSFLTSLRILWSSTNKLPNSFLSANHLESQSFIIPTLNP